MTNNDAPPYILSGGTVLKPGNAVLLTTDRQMDDDEANATIMTLHQKFRDVDFVLVTGFKVFVLDDGEVIVKDRHYPDPVRCTCGSDDGGHQSECPAIGMLDTPVRLKDGKFYGAEADDAAPDQ